MWYLFVFIAWQHQFQYWWYFDELFCFFDYSKCNFIVVTTRCSIFKPEPPVPVLVCWKPENPRTWESATLYCYCYNRVRFVWDSVKVVSKVECSSNDTKHKMMDTEVLRSGIGEKTWSASSIPRLIMDEDTVNAKPKNKDVVSGPLKDVRAKIRQEVRRESIASIFGIHTQRRDSGLEDKRGRRKSWHPKFERKRRKGIVAPSVSPPGPGSPLNIPEQRQKRASWWNIFVPDNWPRWDTFFAEILPSVMVSRFYVFTYLRIYVFALLGISDIFWHFLTLLDVS